MNRRAGLGLLLLAAALRAGDPAVWKAAAPGYAWDFPADHRARPGFKTEWWYFTGHLESVREPGRRFCYQLTLFRLGLLPGAPAATGGFAARDVAMGHLAVGDPATGTHRFAETLQRAGPLLGGFPAPPDPRLAWVLAPPGTEGSFVVGLGAPGAPDGRGTRFTLAARDATEGIGLALEAEAVKPRVFQGPGGLSRKGAGASAASHYYSFTRLATRGTLELGGVTHEVRGLSWMDKEFGSNQLDPHQVGWDWLSLQLEDGRELMLYLLRRAEGAVDFARGTLVEADGAVRWLAADEFTARPEGTWTSPESGAPYPAAFAVEVPGTDLALRVVPVFAAQENRSRRIPDLFYWEGACTVLDRAGRTRGRAYVELTGYGRGRKPGI